MNSLLYLSLVVVAIFLATSSKNNGAEGYTSSGVNNIDRRAIAGLWRLTPRVASLKEFTVHPKRENNKQQEEEEVLLMLKEDGSFQRYEDAAAHEEEEGELGKGTEKDVDQSWKQFLQDGQAKRKDPTKKLFKGTWDYRDGELILAADRDTDTMSTKSDNPEASNSGTSSTSFFYKKEKDTILVGPLVLTKNQAALSNTQVNNNNQADSPQVREEERLDGENATTPMNNNKGNNNNNNNNHPSSSSPTNIAPATNNQQQLSVPMGSVQVGKFMYPKNHPSFFEQPMFQPKRLQNFQLKQVLGNSNAFPEPKEDQFIEKFRNKDFYNKTFFMTSSPNEPRKPKGKSRWSIKYNKYVEEPPNKKAKEEAEAAKNRPANIRVMKVTMFPNNTFSTVEGVGDTILRGKYSVIGEKRDQLWMHITRFGFGRSVSGSVYSEGKTLSHEDAKSYWGKISLEAEDGTVEEADDTFSSANIPAQDIRLQVKGSVIYGYQLEPVPIGRFILREADDLELMEEEDDEEEDDDDDDDEEKSDGGGFDGGIDPWAGAFE